MALSREEVEQLARFAALSLDEGELEAVRGELSAIFGHFEKLLAVDLEGISPTGHASAGAAPLRQDRVRESLSPEAALGNAPEKSGTSFLVPRIIE